MRPEPARSTPRAQEPRDAAPTAAPACVTLALLATIYDVLPKRDRAALWRPAGVELAWTLQGARVESAPLVVGSSPHTLLRAAAWRPLLVEIAEGARRCPWCGCVEQFACVGGCSWLPDGRCSSCWGLAASVARVTLTPGAALPRPPRTRPWRDGGARG